MDILKQLRMYPYEYTRKAADEIEALREESVQLRLYARNMEAARDEALRLLVERQPDLSRIADALYDYNEIDAQDASRYRWLRHNSGYTIRCEIFGSVSMYEHQDTDLDALIDAQMPHNA